MYVKHKDPVSKTLDARLLTELHTDKQKERQTDRQTDMTNNIRVAHPTTISSDQCEVGEPC